VLPARSVAWRPALRTIVVSGEERGRTSVQVLLVEDDGRVAAAMRSALARRGIAIDRVATGRDALARAAGADVVLLDLGLPDLNGFDVCRSIRDSCDAAIIVVSAKSEVDDRILGLHSGADDYLVKPFNVDELVARLHAVLRRRAAPSARPQSVRLEDIEIDIPRFAVTAGGQPLALSRKEFQLLVMIATANGDVCPRERLIAEVWGSTWAGANRTLDVHVATLRTKLDRPGLIETVRGVGYRLAAPTHRTTSAD
jgi:DNA-binding response OmpR family regulator